MIDCLTANILFKVGLGYVSAQAAAIVNQNMIPGLIAIRLCLVSFIPSCSCHTNGINRYNDASIAVFLVSHNKAEIVKNFS